MLGGNLKEAGCSCSAEELVHAVSSLCLPELNMLLLRLLGDDHSTGYTITVVRARSTAEAGYNGNDDGEEVNTSNGNACNSSAAPTTV